MGGGESFRVFGLVKNAINIFIPEMIYFLIQQLKQPGRIELEVLNNGLFGGTRRLVGLGLNIALTQRLLEVRINGVIGLAFTLRRRNPVGANFFSLLLAEILALKLVQAGALGLGVQGEVAEAGLAQRGQFLVLLSCFTLSLVQQFVNVGVFKVSVLNNFECVFFWDTYRYKIKGWLEVYAQNKEK